MLRELNQEFNPRQFSQKKVGLAAFFAAFGLHAVLLTLEVVFEPEVLLIEKRLSVELIKEEETVEQDQLTPESEQPEQSEKQAQPATEPVAPTQPSLNEAPFDSLLESKVLVDQHKSQNAKVSIPSINSERFKTFLRQETERALTDNKKGEHEFSSTFIPPARPQIKNKKRETGPLGGGNYKVVKNGIECETLVQTPQTFSELTGTVPLLSGAGNCRDLNKKIDLVDENSKIRNSDRYEWD